MEFRGVLFRSILPPDRGTPNPHGSSAPAAGSSSRPGKKRTATPSASGSADTPNALPRHRLARTDGDRTAPPWHAAENISAHPPARPSRSAAADTPDSDRKQKIATCFLVAHHRCEKQAPAMTQTPVGLDFVPLSFAALTCRAFLCRRFAPALFARSPLLLSSRVRPSLVSPPPPGGPPARHPLLGSGITR